MKKLKLLLGLSVLVMSTTVFADTIYVNDKQIAVESQKVNNSNYVPIRFVSEELGATVEWQKPNVIVKKDDMVMRLTVGSNTVNVNGKDFSINGMPYISNNLTYVPLRVVSEQLNCDVNYDLTPQGKFVYIKSKGKAFDTPVASLTTDTRKYELSNNEKWGICVEERYLPDGCDHVMILKNMQTGLYKEIYTTEKRDNLCRAYWQKDNQLVIVGTRSLNNEKDNPRIMLYNPETEIFKDIVRDIQGAKWDYETNDLYFKKIGSKTYHVYHLEDGTIELKEEAQKRGEELFAPV